MIRGFFLFEKITKLSVTKKSLKHLNVGTFFWGDWSQIEKPTEIKPHLEDTKLSMFFGGHTKHNRFEIGFEKSSTN